MEKLKTLRSVLVACMLLITTNFALADGIETILVSLKPMKSGKRAVLSLSNLEGRRAMLRIVGSDGEVLFKEEVARQDDYYKVFNLTFLESGKYTLSIRVDGEEVVRQFTIAANKVEVNISE